MTVKTSDCIEEMGRVLLIRCGAPLDGENGSSAVSVEEILKRARRSGARIVLLDLLHTPYADSGGLRWLLSLKRLAEYDGLTLRIACPPEGRVRRNLVLLRAGLEMYDSAHSAWATPLHVSSFAPVPTGGSHAPPRPVLAH